MINGVPWDCGNLRHFHRHRRPPNNNKRQREGRGKDNNPTITISTTTISTTDHRHWEDNNKPVAEVVAIPFRLRGRELHLVATTTLTIRRRVAAAEFQDPRLVVMVKPCRVVDLVVGHPP